MYLKESREVAHLDPCEMWNKHALTIKSIEVNLNIILTSIARLQKMRGIVK